VSLEGDASFDNYMMGNGQQNPCGKMGEVVEMPGGEVVQVLAGPGQQTFRTSDGKQWHQTATGWQMAGGSDYQTDYALERPTESLPGGALRGFQDDSQLGNPYRSQNSFGY